MRKITAAFRTPSLPGTVHRSARFRRGAVKSKFLAVSQSELNVWFGNAAPKFRHALPPLLRKTSTTVPFTLTVSPQPVCIGPQLLPRGFEEFALWVRDRRFPILPRFITRPIRSE
jgi:hypothetical protein